MQLLHFLPVRCVGGDVEAVSSGFDGQGAAFSYFPRCRKVDLFRTNILIVRTSET